MAFIDMRTVIFIMLANNIICMFVLVLLWLQNRRQFSGTGFWAADFALQVTGLLLIAMRGVVPDLFSIVLSNTMIIAGAILGYMGLERFIGKKVPQAHNFILLALFPLVHSYFTYVQPDIAVRTFGLSLALLIVCLQCAWLLLHSVDHAMLPLTRGVGFVFGGFCLVNLVRVIAFFVTPSQQGDIFHLAVFDRIAIALYQILCVLLTYSLVLMVNKRLVMEVRSQEEKFSKAFHSSPYAITLSRLSDGKIFEVNDSFVKITGFQPEEILGKTSFDLHIWVHDEDRSGIVGELSKSGRLSGREIQFKKKSGEPVTGLLSAELLYISGSQCILSSIADITDRKIQEQERERLIEELKKALSEVNMLSGLLPICASCKKIRDDKGYWQMIESYISEHSEAEFSHGICPECAQNLYPEIFEELPDK